VSKEKWENFKIDRKDSGLHSIIPYFLIAMTITSIISSQKLMNNFILWHSSWWDAISFLFYFVLSLLFSILVVIALLEFVGITVESNEKSNWRMSSSSFNFKIKHFLRTAELWEKLFFYLGMLLIIIGNSYGSLANRLYIVIAIILLGMSYYRYYNALKTREEIKEIIPSYPQMHIKQLVKLLGKDVNHVMKSLTYILAYEDFPISMDLKNAILTYHGNSDNSGVNVEFLRLTPIGSERKSKYRPLVCKICGEESESPEAKFCVSCGINLVKSNH
jgi:hypothetical protein